MKRKTTVVVVMLLLTLCCSCAGMDINEATTEPINTQELPVEGSVEQQTTSEPTQNPTSEPIQNTTQENTNQSDIDELFLRGKSVFGENTGTDKTYTGYEPLPKKDFTPTDADNTKGLSTETISHSFGTASDGKPHEISIESQKHFDEGGFKAVTYDNKTSERVLYLTFDCGYENGNTEKILDVLKSKNVPAAFFCTVYQMKQVPDLIARMITEGHIVGNHSVNHPAFPTISRTEMAQELQGFDDYIRENYGYSSPFFRYPEGKYSDSALELVNSFGYTCVFWSVAYADWDVEDQKGPQYAFDTVVARLHPGAVILLHAVSPDNAGALADIIDYAVSEGYSFRSLEQLYS